MNVNDKIPEKMKEEAYELELLKQEIVSIETQIKELYSLKDRLSNILELVKKLKEMKNTGSVKPIYVNLGSGIYLKVNPMINEKILVRLEDKIFIEKDIEEVENLIQTNISQIDQSIKELETLKLEKVKEYSTKVKEFYEKYKSFIQSP